MEILKAAFAALRATITRRSQARGLPDHSIFLTSADSTSLCDYYTTALLRNNTAANQLTVLTLLVNTIVIGNYTKPNIPGITFPDVAVPGILAEGTVNGSTVNLRPYFDGGLASSNRGGSAGVAVNFLDDGGAEALMGNAPAFGTFSNQYFLLTHLYQFFGTALGCSQQSTVAGAFPAYGGIASQYQVHKYMALNNNQVGYFIQQVALAATSFGFSAADVTTIGTLLDNTFNRRCSPNQTVIASAGPVQQAICIDNDCPLADNPTCSAYAAVVVPGVANPSLADGLGNSSSTATMSSNGSAAATSPTSASATSTTSNGSMSNDGLSSGAKIGIGLGVGLGAALVLAAMIVVMLRRKRRKGRYTGRNAAEKDLRSQREPGVSVEADKTGVAVN